MIKDVNFISLKTELSNAIVAFEKDEVGFKLFFNNHMGFQDFKQNLNHLYYEFTNEIQDNLNRLKSDEQSKIYLEMLLHVFEILDDQVGVFPDFVIPHRNVKIISKANTKLSCIYTCSEDLSQMIIYFQHQKKIILKSRKFIWITLKSFGKLNNHGKISILSWKDELKEFYPDMIRIKDEVHKIFSVSDKIRFLHDERINLSKVYEKKGRDLYSSVINFFFESQIDCCKDWLIHESKLKNGIKIDYEKNGIEFFLIDLLNTLEIANSNISKDKIKTGLVKGIQIVKSFSDGNLNLENEKLGSLQLNWTESKTALVELIYALHSSHSINEGRIDIKTISERFESLFSMELGDIYHTFSEIRNRKTEPTKFIDLLKDSLLIKMKETDEKSCK